MGKQKKRPGKGEGARKGASRTKIKGLESREFARKMGISLMVSKDILGKSSGDGRAARKGLGANKKGLL